MPRRSTIILRAVSSTIGELFSFLWQQRIWWLAPLIVLLLIFALLIILGATAGIGPFIYPLF